MPSLREPSLLRNANGSQRPPLQEAGITVLGNQPFSIGTRSKRTRAGVGEPNERRGRRRGAARERNRKRTRTGAKTCLWRAGFMSRATRRAVSTNNNSQRVVGGEPPGESSRGRWEVDCLGQHWYYPSPKQSTSPLLGATDNQHIGSTEKKIRPGCWYHVSVARSMCEYSQSRQVSEIVKTRGTVWQSGNVGSCPKTVWTWACLGNA